METETVRFKTVLNGGNGYIAFRIVNEPYEPKGPWPCERCCQYVNSAEHDCQEAI